MIKNYYVEQIDHALSGNDDSYNLTMQIHGTKNSTKNMTLPFELARIIKEWYYLNGDKV